MRELRLTFNGRGSSAAECPRTNLLRRLLSDLNRFGIESRAAHGNGKVKMDTFIRASTTKENHGGIDLRRGYHTIAHKAGYEVCFKPYGEQGRGYYYVPVSDQTPQWQRTATREGRRMFGYSIDFDRRSADFSYRTREQAVRACKKFLREPNSMLENMTVDDFDEGMIFQE